MTLCYIGLGANLDDPAARVVSAMERLADLASSRVVARSSLYRTQPVGPQDQPDFINAVLALETSLSPLALLDAMQAMERAQGRVRGAERWGPRTLDLDLLLFGGHCIDQPRLRVPHPRLHERLFVLQPLLEIAPDLRLPDGRPIVDLLAGCPALAVRRVDPRA